VNTTTLIPILGFGPALAVLYFALWRYDGFFDDRRVFLTMIVGLAMGMLVAFFNAWVHPLYYFYGYILGLPALEELFKLIVLNTKRFHGRFDTVFYGVSLGVGIGSMVTVAFLYLGLTTLGAAELVIVLALSFGLCFLHASTGVIIGWGVSKYRAWRGLGYAILIHVVANVTLTPFLLDLPGRYVALAAFFGIAALSFFFAVFKMIPDSFPQELKALMRRERRRSMGGGETAEDPKAARMEATKKVLGEVTGGKKEDKPAPKEKAEKILIVDSLDDEEDEEEVEIVDSLDNEVEDDDEVEIVDSLDDVDEEDA